MEATVFITTRYNWEIELRRIVGGLDVDNPCQQGIGIFEMQRHYLQELHQFNDELSSALREGDFWDQLIRYTIEIKTVSSYRVGWVYPTDPIDRGDCIPSQKNIKHHAQK